MLRRKEVAASPLRDSIETADVIATLIANSLSSAKTISAASVTATLSAAIPAIRMLVAAGHLDHTPLTLVAGDTACEIFTVSGKAALHHDENLNPVLGMTSATTYTLYLPGDVLVAVVEAADEADGNIALGTPDPSAIGTSAAAQPSTRTSLIDFNAIRAAMEKQ